MILNFIKSTFLLVLITTLSCGNNPEAEKVLATVQEYSQEKNPELVLGANRTEAYLPMLKDKKVGIVGNHTSIISIPSKQESKESKYIHLVDSLMSLDVNVVKVFAPEHGFRGKADAGEVIKDGIDVKTGLPIVSLYGDNKKPSPQQLKGIDIMVFDIQDVGTRFYTYLSTLHYVMEACAENNIPLIVLDRPNPNGHYIDGPILEPQHKSFVGMHPVPVVHGLTFGEYAKMINGEEWLKNDVKTDLTVIEMKNYAHDMQYDLPVKPSPNLPNAKSINLYPSLCFFEGTNVNAGRGTPHQFQVFGSPFLDRDIYEYSYVPESNAGSKYPKHKGKTCYGKNLTDAERLSKINLKWLIEAYQNTADKSEFFKPYFTKLAGTTKLQEQIEAGLTAKEIRESWEEGLAEYGEIRDKYLLYE
ncbi:MAG TPA: DUF1343 domain-containing protein [Salinimicrobium sp.]|nr:DUF1343 domain-containing protein [Salinimicrobium sp.]